MNPDEIEKIELELFLEATHLSYCYDFHHYTRAQIRRCAHHVLASGGEVLFTCNFAIRSEHLRPDNNLSNRFQRNHVEKSHRRYLPVQGSSAIHR